MKNKYIGSILILFIYSLFTTYTLADTYPKRELRSSWLATVYALDWPKSTGKATSASGVATQKSELDALLDNLKNAGFNAVSFQVRSMCDAMYKSSYEPWNQYLSGTRGTAPYNNFDPLEYCVQQAHARGMECHAWINPFRFAASNGSAYKTTQDNYYRNNGMLMTHTISSSTVTILNPALESVRTRIKDICHEIATNYDIDGIMFDDYFYNPEYIPEDETAADYTLYEDYISRGGAMTMADWRRDNINKTMKLVYDDLQTIKNGTIRFGIGPAGIGGGNGGDGIEPHADIPSLDRYGIITNDSQYYKIYSDPVAWLKGGYIDYISPQIYWVTTQKNHPFGPLCKWWSDVAFQFNRHCYVSHTITAFASSNTTDDWNERITQINLNREYSNNNSPGCVLYSTAYISGHKASGFGAQLKTNTFKYNALPPEITWKSLADPGKVNNLKRSGTTLSWDNLGSNMRYTIYAIPLTVSPKDAASTVHSGIKAEYLLDFTYNKTYTLPSNKTSGYWYAVAPFDRLCKEWEATTIDAPPSDPVNVSLISPENGTIIDAHLQEFFWEGDDEATFTIEISPDANFSTIAHSEKTTDKSIVIDSSILDVETTYYWRIVAERNGYFTTTTEAKNFKTPQLPTYPTPWLYKLDNNATVSDDLLFIVTDVYADITYLEISTTSDFSSIFYCGATRWLPILANDGLDYLEYTLPISYFTNGTYYWRVRTEKEGYKNGISSTRTFNVVNQESQTTSYTTKREQYEYPYIYTNGSEGLTLTNIWIRSEEHGNSLGQEGSGTYNRDFCARATDNTLYISGRDASQNAYLDCYNATTGAYIKRLNISGNFATSYQPCNGVFLDDKENICIHNMTLSSTASTYSLQISTINPSTGVATKRFSASTPDRIDHCDVVGDVTSEFFYVVAVSSTNNTKIFRWTVLDGVPTLETQTITGYYPTTVKNFGTAPRIYAVDDSYFFIDSMSTDYTLYQWGNSSAVASFSQASTLAPSSSQGNGGTFFTHDGIPFIIYAAKDHNNADGYKYNLTTVSNITGSFSGMKNRWELPHEFLGKTSITGGDIGVLADVIQYKSNATQRSSNPDVTHIYLYVPANGLAAYTLTRLLQTDVEEITQDNINISIKNGIIEFGTTVNNVTLYSLSGKIISLAVETTCMEAPILKGVYFLRFTINDKIITEKIIIK